MQVVISHEDADRLIRALYLGRRPARVHTLLCGCGAHADLREDPRAWLDWQVLPFPLCPACRGVRAPYTGPARLRYLQLVEKLAGPAGCAARSGR